MQILPFSEKNLSISLSNKYTPPELISCKNHFLYFKDYLGEAGLNAKTIVVEEDYISKDFLHDYSSYYSLCFKPYPKFCKRVHFFQNSFSDDVFTQSILDSTNSNKEFWDNYLGFIVVKPIPVTVIGFTVLKTYSNCQTFNDRNFWGIRDYNIHLFGNNLKISSLAFQEQDSVLAACATTAIWSMLNKAAVDYHTILKSPSQITKDADKVSSDGSRLFPNKGLNLLQICQAIQNSGLVSEIKQDNFPLKNDKDEVILKVVSVRFFKKILNAYSQIGIPIILVINVPNSPSGSSYGLHAITISGFKQKSPIPLPPNNEISWLSDNIEKFYAHDDQWGPFARIDFKDDCELITPWSSILAPGHPTYAMNVVVPLYPKIRISYENIEAIVLGIDRILTFFFANNIIADLVWDVKLQFSESFKSSIRNSNLDKEEKVLRLTKSLPKYLWVATCYIGEHKVFDFTFDATDVNSAMFGEDFVCYLTPDVKPLLSEFLVKNRALLQQLFNHISKSLYYDFLIKQLSL